MANTHLEANLFDAVENVTSELERGRPKGMVISVRLPAPEAEKLVALCEETGQSISHLAREAIQAFIMRGGKAAHLQWSVQAATNADQLILVYSGDAGRTEGPGVEVDAEQQSVTGLFGA